MENLNAAAQELIPDVACIAIVAELLSDGGYLVQVAGRMRSFAARSLSGGHRVGDAVIVLLEPNALVPVILGASPWRVVSEVSPAYIFWPGISPHDPALDIVDAVAAAALVPDVASNYAARHDRAHSLLSSLDHDVSGSASYGEVFGYSGGSWRAIEAPSAPAPAARFARRFMMMGA